MEEKTTPKKIDPEFYISKFAIPLLERKWIVIVFLTAGVLISLLLASFIKPQYISEAAVQVEEPSTELTSIRDDSVTPRQARSSYVIAVEEKLKSNTFAQEVLKILPEEVKEDLRQPLDYRSQIIAGLKNMVKKMIGWEKKKVVNSEGQPDANIIQKETLLKELEIRVGIRVNPGTAMIWITGAALDKNLAPILVKSYLDYLIALNMEDNKKGIRGKLEFAKSQTGSARKSLTQAEENLTAFRNHYQIPGDVRVIGDSQIQLQLDTLLSKLEMAKERYERIDKLYMTAAVNEAGVVVNIKVLNSPMIPLRATKSAANKVLLIGIMGSLAVGIGLVLMVDQVKGTIRYSTDIIDAVHLPIMGNIPKL